MKKVLSCQIFLQSPPHFSPSMEAAGCYCSCADKLLLVQRQSYKSQGNKWGVPAGKLESQEDPLSAVIREMYEEVGIILIPDKVAKIKTLYIRLSECDYIYHMFYTSLTSLPELILNLEENQEARWTTLSEAIQLPLVAAGREALLYYKSYLLASSSMPIFQNLS